MDILQQILKPTRKKHGDHAQCIATTMDILQVLCMFLERSDNLTIRYANVGKIKWFVF